jgi:hypothetical protein
LLLPFGLFFGYPLQMSDAIAGTRKKRGRPATGRVGVMVKFLPDQLARLDAARTDGETRPEAIRRILDQVLDSAAD